MKSIVIIVLLIVMGLSLLLSLFWGAIKWAIILGVGFVIVGVIKTVMGKSDSSGGA